MDAHDEILLQIRDLLERLVDQFELAHLDELRLARKRAEESLGDKNSTKRQIYDLLDGTRGVGEIAKLVKTSQPNVSLHLKDMLQEGLVSVRSEKGKRMYQKRWEV